MARETRFSYDTLHLFARSILVAAGASIHHSKIVADHLADSNLFGHDSHGIHRLLQYCSAIDKGQIQPEESPHVVSEGMTTAVFDATKVFGQVAGLTATEAVITKARQYGTAVVGVRNSYHIGRAGVYALKLANSGLVGQIFCSGRGAGFVAPWGGTTPILSTNPIAIGIPTASDPIILDTTTSVTAEGKIRVARFAKKSLPLGQILDQEGNPSTSPEDFYNHGSMLPLGGEMGHKGYGLSVIVDLVGALLTGSRAGQPRGEKIDFSNNFTIWAVDPNALGGRNTMEELQDEYFELLKSSDLKPGIDEIFLPGEPENKIAATRRRDGLPLDDSTISQLDKLASHFQTQLLSSQEIRS